MADYLFVRLGDATENIASVVLNGDGRIVEPMRVGPLEGIASAAEGRRVIVLVPASETVTTRVVLPKASQARLRQLLPFSLEETFAADIESLHFAAGPRSVSGSVAVTVAARDRVAEWVSRVEAVGLKPYAVYSEADGVPDTPSTLNLVVEGARVYGRRPGDAPFALEGLAIAEVLALLAGQSGDTVDLQHLLVYVDSGAKERRMGELAEVQARVASLDVKDLVDGVLPRLAATLVFEPGANLLQGLYAPKSDLRALLRPWYATAGLLLAWVVLTLVLPVTQYFALRAEDRALTEQLVAVCARSFGSTQLQACRAEMQSRLAAAGVASSRGESFLSTLAVIAESQGEGKIEAMSYRNRVLDLQLVVPSIALLDELAQRIDDADGYDARIQSANPGESGVDGRIQVVGVRE